MLVLPAFRIVETHVAHGLSRMVGVANVSRKFHDTVRGEDPRSVSLGTLYKVFTEIHNAIVAEQAGKV